jgi:hypothetical protein
MINRVEFQRAAEGRYLDDVIVKSHDAEGSPAVLEIQVKRQIKFTRTDQEFRKVVGQIVRTSRKTEFSSTRYELAIATARTSQKIDGAYQDVLTWARQIGDATTFMARINRPGSANEDMRTFVQTFKANLREAGSSDDDGTVKKLLSRLQILVFDFTAQGSACEALVRERVVHALHLDETQRVESLWTALIELALHIAAAGGDRTRDHLLENLKERAFRFASYRRYSSARAALSEASRHALADINDSIGRVKLTRHTHTAAVHASLESGRYVEIRGDSGVGKSGVLKHFAEQIGKEAPIIVLSPKRTVPRGWGAMKGTLGFDGSAHELLADLAADGGAVLFVDNLDFFDEDEKKTVKDLVRETTGVPGFVVIATARRNFGMEEPNWLPSDALDSLGRAQPIMISELTETELDELRHADPRLAPLLDANHPAREVSRNLFRLARLSNQPEAVMGLRTEVDMAKQWWQTADGTRDDLHRERSRLLRALAEAALSGIDVLDVAHQPPRAVDALVKSETLRDLGHDRVAFRHDVLREWAIGNLLHFESERFDRLPLDRPAPAALARGIELAARMVLEHASESTQWQSVLDRLSGEGVHGSWRRAVLLALVRSEISYQLLACTSSVLLAKNGSLLRELIRLVMAVDVEPAGKIYAALGVDPRLIAGC